MDAPLDYYEAEAGKTETPTSVLTPSSWIKGICILYFDLEYGQMIESKLPKDLSLSKSEETNVCFLSFPDSNSHREGDVSFTFRIRMGKKGDALHQKYLIGFVFFRQARDPSIQRGFLQKSVVLLTERPYYGLFRSVVKMLGDAYFSHGFSALEVAFAGITSEWGIPRAGRTYSLPLLGSVLQFRIPFSLCPHMVDGEDSPTSVSGGDVAHHISITNSDGIDLYRLFRHQISALWRLWEIALTCEPLLIHSSESPLICGSAVLAVVSLISPLKMYGDFRPYFTIHDSEFKEYSDPENIPHVTLGATNPFFLKALDHWPNVLFIQAAGKNSTPSGTPGRRTGKSRTNLMLSPPNHKLRTKEKATLTPDKLVMRGLLSSSADRRRGVSASRPAISRKSTKVSGKGSSLQTSSLPGVGGNEKGSGKDASTNVGDAGVPPVGTFAVGRVTSDPRIAQGNDTTSRSDGAVKCPGSTSDVPSAVGQADTKRKKARRVASALTISSRSSNQTLRRYFRDLTERFLIPLESYVATLMPLDKDVSPFKTCPRMHAFKVNEFLAMVKRHRPLLTGKEAKDVSLYRRFLASPNFKGWLRIRQQRTRKHLAALYLEKVLLLDVSEVLGKPDFEVIDLYLRIKSQGDEVPRRSPLRVRLLEKSREVLSCLQDDLRASIVRNELASANLLQTRTEQSGSM